MRRKILGFIPIRGYAPPIVADGRALWRELAGSGDPEGRVVWLREFSLASN